MRKMVLLASMVALAAMMLAAAPASAQTFFDCDNNDDFFDCDNNDGFFLIGDDFDRNDFCFDDDFFFDDDFCFDDDDFFDNDGFFDDGFQSFDQEADSGDVDQSFDVTGGGDNSNQTANVSGTANTGNVQDQFGFVQIDSEIDEFEIDDSGSELTIGGDSDVSSDQQVNQAASSGR